MRNFGIIREAYNRLMIEGLISNDQSKKDTYKTFLKNVSKSPILKKQVRFYNLMENIHTIDEDSRDIYINECLNSVFTKDDINNIINENATILIPLFEHEVDLESFQYDKRELHENITKLLHVNKTSDNIKTIVEGKSFLKKYITTGNVIKNDKDILPTKVILETAILKINSTYPNITKEDAKIITSVMTNNVSEQQNIFNDLLSECNKIIDNISSDISSDLLNNAKNKLSEMVYNKDTFKYDVVKLIELKESLK